MLGRREGAGAETQDGLRNEKFGTIVLLGVSGRTQATKKQVISVDGLVDNL
jgi:hypothetical protein